MRTLARQGDRTEILRRLRALHPDRAARWGQMSAGQMVCHLSDGFRMATGQKAVSPAAGVLQRTILKWIVLYVPVPWPAGVPTRPEIDQELGGTRPVSFAADVAGLEALVELVASEPTNLDGRAHPLFGRMSGPAWLRWGYLHMDHHLRQFGI